VGSVPRVAHTACRNRPPVHGFRSQNPWRPDPGPWGGCWATDDPGLSHPVREDPEMPDNDGTPGIPTTCPTRILHATNLLDFLWTPGSDYEQDGMNSGHTIDGTDRMDRERRGEGPR